VRAPRTAHRAGWLVSAPPRRRRASLPLRMLRTGRAPTHMPEIMSSALSARRPRPQAARALHAAGWWPLVAVVLLAAALRFSTLDLQSFWYDEAFTPVHVLHAGLASTMRSMVHSENSPPLWYLLTWLDVRLFGDGAIALRTPSAIAGVLTVPVAWAIGGELCGRRCALLAAALVAVNPLFVWYSQEARVYALFVLTSALALLCFLRARREPTPARMAGFAVAASLALLSHYFALFLLVPMALSLLASRSTRRATLPAIAALCAVGAALLPLVIAQGGHGTQWIGRWALTSRLEAIPQYYLTGYSGAPLGHGVELLVALPILAGVGLGLWQIAGAPAHPAGGGRGRAAASQARGPDRARIERGALLSLLIAAAGVLAPI